MKIFIACSKWHYGYIPEVKQQLEEMGFEVILPNFYENPLIEEQIKKDMSREDHIAFCQKSFEMSRQKSKESDAILVLNYPRYKEGKIYLNYIGGATFLEMYDSYLFGHPIFLYNPIPTEMFEDEIKGMNPVVLNGNLSLLKNAQKRK